MIWDAHITLNLNLALWLCSRLWDKIDHDLRGNTNTISFLKAHSSKMALKDLLVSSYLRRVGKYKTNSMVLFCGHFVAFLFVFSHIIIFSIFLELCFCGYFVHFMVLPLYFVNRERGNIIFMLREYLGTTFCHMAFTSLPYFMLDFFCGSLSAYLDSSCWDSLFSQISHVLWHT